MTIFTTPFLNQPVIEELAELERVPNKCSPFMMIICSPFKMID